MDHDRIVIALCVFLGFFVAWSYSDYITAAFMWVLDRLVGTGKGIDGRK